MVSPLNRIYLNPVFGKILHPFVYIFRNELIGCKSVLDLGCGYTSPLQYCDGVGYSVGVEAFKPYITISKKNKIHSKYIHSDILKVDFSSDSFDAVIMTEVLEHLNSADGIKLLKKIKRWAKKKVVITSPNGYFPQEETDKNPLQAHKSGWDVNTMNSLGFKCRGNGGFSRLRKNLYGNEGQSGLVQLFWISIATISQSIAYFFPQYSFGIISVYTKKQ